MDINSSTIYTTMFLSFITFFATVSPINVFIIFLRLTKDYSKEKKAEVKNKSIFIASIMLIVITLIGPSGFKLLGIDIYSVKIAGGIVLAMVSIAMVFGEQKEVSKQDLKVKQLNIVIVPLAMPIICGPAAIVSSLVLFSQYHDFISKAVVFLMLIANLIILYISLTLADIISKYIKKSIINILFILSGIMLTALATQFIVNGIKEAGIFHKVSYNHSVSINNENDKRK